MEKEERVKKEKEWKRAENNGRESKVLSPTVSFFSIQLISSLGPKGFRAEFHHQGGNDSNIFQNIPQIIIESYNSGTKTRQVQAYPRNTRMV